MSPTSFPRILEENIVPETNTNTTEGSSNSNLTAAILTNIFLFFLIFGLSATVHIRKLKNQLQNKFALLTGVGMQFIVMPLLGFASVMIFKGSSGFTEAMGLALLVVTSSPGGSYSNWWCSLFNADLALSVAMTAVSTVLSVGMLPANLLLYSHLAYNMNSDSDTPNVVSHLDFMTLFITLGIVMGAIISGLYASYKVDSLEFMKWANRGASVSGIALILVSAFLSSVGTESSFWNQDWEFYVGVSTPCLLGISLANIVSRSFRLKKPECVSISIECCYQNTGIATSVAVTMFSDPEQRAQAVAVPLFYGFIEAVVIGVFCLWAWKAGWTKAPAKEKIWVILTKTYEVEEEALDQHSAQYQAGEEEGKDEDDKKEDTTDEEQGGVKPDDENEFPNSDMPNIVEEGEHAAYWWQFWRPRARCDSALSDDIAAAPAYCTEQEMTSTPKKRSRLETEDTVATGSVSTAPPTPSLEPSCSDAANDNTKTIKDDDDDEKLERTA